MKMHLKMAPVKWRPFCPGEMSWSEVLEIPIHETGSNIRLFNSLVHFPGVNELKPSIFCPCYNWLQFLCWLWSWWRHQMENGFRVTDYCAGKLPVSYVGFDVFFDASQNKRLSKQLICRWFETPCPRHCHTQSVGLLMRRYRSAAPADGRHTLIWLRHQQARGWLQ